VPSAMTRLLAQKEKSLKKLYRRKLAVHFHSIWKKI